MRLSILSVAMTFLLSAVPAAAQYKPHGPIEQKYSAEGPWKVSSIATAQGCDREGNVCDIWYPTELGTSPIRHMIRHFRHPVIVFADGTAQNFIRGTSKVTGDSWGSYLRHLATWGFVVIRSRDGSTRRGDTVLDVAAYISALGQNPKSIFFDRIDPTRFGLTGHSQGAATTVLLFSKNNTVFKTFVAVETPLRVAMFIAHLSPDFGALAKVDHGSIFYIGGGLSHISPRSTNLSYYQSTSNNVQKVMGIVSLAKHGDASGTPTCPVSTPCNLGVYPYLGFPTAWFMWKLQDAADGADAFRTNGQLEHDKPNWVDVVTNIPR